MHQFYLSAAQGEFDTAYNVVAVARLRIQRRLDGQHGAGSQIEKLRGNRSGPQIDRNAETNLRSKPENGMVAQDGHFPLREFQFQIAVEGMPTRQAPTIGKFCFCQDFGFLGVRFQLASQEPDAAAFASSLAAAGKLDALFKQHIL